MRVDLACACTALGALVRVSSFRALDVFWGLFRVHFGLKSVRSSCTRISSTQEPVFGQESDLHENQRRVFFESVGEPIRCEASEVIHAWCLKHV